MSGRKDERIAAIAARQRGRVSRKQLLAAGIGSGAIDRMLATGGLHARHQGVYAVGYATPVELGDETAALLACSHRAVLSHWSAVAMWKLIPAAPPGPIHVTIPGSGHRDRPGIAAHRTTRLDRQDVRSRHGLPVTSPARTLLDMAAELSNRQLERALDEGLATGTVRLSQVEDAVARLPKRHGASRLRALLDPRRPRTTTRSDGEERLLAAIRAADLPEPELNYSWGVYTIDLFWPRLRVAVEVDGYPYHSTRTAFERDRRKDAALKAAGIDVIRISYDQLEQEPLAVIALIAQRLQAARP